MTSQTPSTSLTAGLAGQFLFSKTQIKYIHVSRNLGVGDISNLNFPEFDCGLEAGLLEAAGRVEAVLERGPGPWLAGPALALSDLALGPKLHHMQVTVAELCKKQLI